MCPRFAPLLLVCLLFAVAIYGGASCIIQKAETSIRVTESFDQDTGQLFVSARLTYTNLDTGKTEGLGQQELEFIVNYTTNEGEKSDKFKMQTDTNGWATVNFVIPGATKHTVVVLYKGNNVFKGSTGTVSGSGKSSTSFETGLPSDINLVACFPLLLLMGFLGAAMYASGRNPFGVVDFTAPRGITTQRRVIKAFQAGWASALLGTAGGALGAIATAMVGAKEEGKTTPKQKEGEKKSQEKETPPPKMEKPKGMVKGSGGPLKSKPKEKEPTAKAQAPPVMGQPSQPGKRQVTLEEKPRAEEELTAPLKLPNVVPVVSNFASVLGGIGALLSLLGGYVWPAQQMKIREIKERDKDGKETIVRRLVSLPMTLRIINEVHRIEDEIKARHGSITKDGGALVLIYKDNEWKFVKLSDTKKELENCKTNLAKEKAQAEEQRNKNIKKQEKLEGFIENTKENISRLKEEFAINNKVLNAKKEEAKNIEDTKIRLEKEKASLEAKIAGIKTEGPESTQIREKIKEINTQIKEVSKKLEITLSEVGTLSQRKSIISEKLTKAEIELKQAEYKKELLQKNSSVLSERIGEIDRDIKKIDNMLKDIGSTMADNKQAYEKYVSNLWEKYGQDLEKAGIKKDGLVTPAMLDSVIEQAKKDAAAAKTKDEKAALEKKAAYLEDVKEKLQGVIVESQKTESAAYITLKKAESILNESRIAIGRGRFLCDSSDEAVAKADVFDKIKFYKKLDDDLYSARDSLNKAEYHLAGKSFGKTDDDKKPAVFENVSISLKKCISIASELYGGDSTEVANLAKLANGLGEGKIDDAISGINKFMKKARDDLKDYGNDTANLALRLGVGAGSESIKMRELPPGEEKLAKERGEVPPYGVVVERSVPYPGGIDALIKSILEDKSARESSITQTLQITKGEEGTIQLENKNYTITEVAKLSTFIDEPDPDKGVALLEKDKDAANALRKMLGLNENAKPADIYSAYSKMDDESKYKTIHAIMNTCNAQYAEKAQSISQILSDAAMRDYGGFFVKAGSLDNAIQSLIKDAEAKTVGKIVVFKEQEDYYKALIEYNLAVDDYNNLQNKLGSVEMSEKDKKALLEKEEEKIKELKKNLATAERNFDGLISKIGGNAERFAALKSEKAAQDWYEANNKLNEEKQRLTDPNYALFRIRQNIEKGDEEFYAGGEKGNYEETLKEIEFASQLNNCTLSSPAGKNKLTWLEQ